METTLAYLQDLIELMKRADRGVLREEICSSIRAIYGRLLDRNNESRVSEWEAFASYETNKSEFFMHFENIYEMLGKWAKKSKHVVFSLKTMAFMLTVAPEEFTTAHTCGDHGILALLTAAAKKSEHRIDSLEIIKTYLLELPKRVVNRVLEEFTADLKAFVHAFVPKNKSPPEGSSVALIDVFTAIGQCHMVYFVNEVVPLVLQEKAPYSTGHKSILLRALAAVAQTDPEAISKYDYALGPIVSMYIETSEDAELIRSAIQCFPHVRQPSSGRVAVTASRVGQLTLEHDREIATGAALALQRFVLLSPTDYFIPSVYYFLDMLRDVRDLQPEDLLKACQSIHFLFDSIKEDISSALVEPALWVSLRHHVEGLCIVWLCHPEAWVRSEMLRLVNIFHDPVYRNLEPENSTPFVCDILNPGGEVEPDFGGPELCPKVKI